LIERLPTADDRSFGSPINAKLVEAEDITCILIWRRSVK
jgi:uncharacterized protein (DUF736 family)